MEYAREICKDDSTRGTLIPTWLLLPMTVTTACCVANLRHHHAGVFLPYAPVLRSTCPAQSL
ncbi:hypothetical protein BDR04DRAFT_100616 [Suillus decipiens]|nr:hypothetical protein BDR04DRAFT_100616 [Suillus decipiens]